MTTRFQFPKENRLLKSSDFRILFELGTKSVNSLLVVIAMARPAGTTSHRLGLVVSKKVGNSVVRNQVKRRIRELFRTKVNSWQFADQRYDFVVIARSNAATAESSVLENSFSKCCSRSVKNIQASLKKDAAIAKESH